MKKRFYDPRQFEVMRHIDPLAVERDRLANVISQLICVQCGNVETFKSRVSVEHIVSSKDGAIVLTPIQGDLLDFDPGEGIEYADLFDRYWEAGNILVAVCAECDGAVVPRVEVYPHCKDKACYGCLLCGRVTNKAELEEDIRDCDVCLGGEHPCDCNCGLLFMRRYHGYHPSPEEGFKEIARYDAGGW